MPGPVERWLETFMCKQYADIFEAYGFKTLQSVCQLQESQLHVMGVAQEHCEQILENVHVLRQSLRGNMNQFQSDMYSGNMSSQMGYPNIPNHCTPPNMIGMHGRSMSGYGPHGYGGQQQSMFTSQDQYNMSEQFYSSHATGQSMYMGYSRSAVGGSYPQSQYGPSNRRDGVCQVPYDHITNNSGCQSGMGAPMAPQSQQQNQNYGRQNSLNQSPQEVANNILQMAANSYQPSQTVHVPLNKSNRPAPYHIPPKSPIAYNMHPSSKQYIMNNHQFMYPNMPQGSRTSPDDSMYMHSPASHHSGQSLPNSSPRSIHSPSHSIGNGCKKSPSAMTVSPVGDLRSPLQMQSPVNIVPPPSINTPLNQQLHVSVPPSHQSPQSYANEMVSPHYQKIPSRYSPKTNPISPATLYNRSRSSSVHSSNSTDHFISDTKYINEAVFDSSNEPQNKSMKATNPLSSLQQLCMLPERQVIDPKSIVNEAYLESSGINENQKNSDSGADYPSQNIPVNNQEQESASRKLTDTPGEEKCLSNLKCISPNKLEGTDVIQSNVDTENSENCTNNERVENKVKKSDKQDDNKIFNKTSECQNLEQQLCCNNDSVCEKQEEINTQEYRKAKEENCSNEQVNLETVAHKFHNSQEKEDNSIQEPYKAQTGEKQDSAHIKNEMTQPPTKSDSIQDVCQKQLEAVNSLPETMTEEFRTAASQDSIQPPPDQNCNVEQCKNAVLRVNGNLSKSRICTVETNEDSILPEHKKVLDKVFDFEKMSNENNNEIHRGLNGITLNDSCIQYYKPKSVKKSKRALENTKKPKYAYDKSIRSKILSRVNEFSSSSNEAISINSSLPEKVRLQQAQVRRNRSLHAVSARVTCGGHVERMINSDSDSDDEGYLMVRKDDQRTYDRSARVLTELRRTLTDSITSQEGDISSDNESSYGITKFCEKEKENVKEVICNEAGSGITSKNSETNSNLESDKNKTEKRMTSEDKKGANVIMKYSENLVKSVNEKSVNVKNKKNYGRVEKSGTKKPQNTSEPVQKTSNDTCAQDEIDGVNFKTSDANGDKSSSKNKTTSNASHEAAQTKRVSRRRRRTSPMKYGDLYYGADYVIDSDEEIEVEKQSKRCRKSKIAAQEMLGHSDAIVIDDSEDEDDDDYVPNQKEIEEFKSVHEEFSEDKSKNIIKPQEPKPGSSKPVKDAVKTPKEKEKRHSIGKVKRKQCDINLKRQRAGKSSKGKLRKFEHSIEKFKYDHDSIQNMKLKRTLDLMKQKDKKMKDVSVEAKPVGPFIRLNKRKNSSSPTSCHVINITDSEQLTDSKKITKKTTSVSVSTVHMSKVPSEKSVIVPNSVVMDESNWMCALCKKHSSFKFLGDLFGPYYVEGNLPSSKESDCVNSHDSNKLKKRRTMEETLSSSCTLDGQKVRGRRKSATISHPPLEVWVHEDCVAWADGVLLIGSKIYGLEEAASIASSTICSVCNTTGATVGCLHKGCSQKFHVTCAVEADCYMDEENFSLLCSKHKSRILKKSQAASMKT